MDKINSKTILWQNVLTLMKMRYGKKNMGRLAEMAHVGPATMTRLKEQKTSIGTEVLEQIAQALEVEVWQLLCPGYDFSRPAKQTPQDALRSGKDLQMIFDMIPVDSPTREPAYNACFDVLMDAKRRAANQSIPDTSPSLNSEISRA